MKSLKYCIVLCFLMISGNLLAATTLNPVITPALFKFNTPITVTYDVTGTPLEGLTAAYAWVWIPGSTAIDAKYNLTPANAAANQALTANAKFVLSTVNGRKLWTLTFTPSEFFVQSIATATQMGILLKGNDWADGQTTDFLVNFWDGSFQTKLTSPTQQPLFVHNGDHITVSAETPVTANYTLTLNNKLIDSQNNLTAYTYDLVVSDTASAYTVKVTGAVSGNTSSSIFYYNISSPSDVMQRPAGIIDGINYSADLTKATLSLWAPNKTSVYVVGDFNAWKVAGTYKMKKDGEHFWLEIGGLTAQTEYGFQYLVDESLYVADPYADKILDTDDQYIPATTYPNLKVYPTAAKHSDWYFNRVAVLQTGQSPYTWTAANYVRPAKEKLVIYELLVRDFFDSNHRNYQSLIDTIAYFKRLGINAIELMPITEFNGNDSWGYNPTFMFAPDKYYGTKNKLKEFIDTCHKNGIAVIMDIVMNQQDLPNPYALMYFDFTNMHPTASNPWFNVAATHPFSVFYDLNHESKYTKKYLDTVNYHWTNEYKVDGFRYDLAKGFTQTNNPTNVSAWGNYDQSRINIFTRMADVLWATAPDTYIILEYFADNTEEKVLANYKADEGKGMMLWENFNYNAGQASLGFSDGADWSASYYANKGWNKPREVSYIESHDEERLMYKNLMFGNAAGTYNVKTLNTALSRIKAVNLMFFTIPGAKMVWEFGELGYDKSINTCTDGTISDNCRITAKPVLWNYQTVSARAELFNHTADIFRLRRSFSVFTEGTASIVAGNSLLKQMVLKHSPYSATPVDSTQLNAVAAANLDIATQSIIISFPHDGNWFDYYDGGKTIAVSGLSSVVSFQPGSYKLYTDVKITKPKTDVITGIEDKLSITVQLYPNPANEALFVQADNQEIISLSLRSVQGTRVSPGRISATSWDIKDIPTGIYIAEILTNEKLYRIRVLKK